MSAFSKRHFRTSDNNNNISGVQLFQWQMARSERRSNILRKMTLVPSVRVFNILRIHISTHSPTHTYSVKSGVRNKCLQIFLQL